MKVQVLVFMSEIKFNLTLKQSNFLFRLCCYLQLLSFYLLFDSHVRKQTFFFFLPFRVNFSCSTCLVGIIFGRNAVLHLDN